MKQGWTYKKLGEVCEIVGGGTPSKNNSAYYNGNIPWATVRDMNCEYLSSTEYSISEEGLNNSSSHLINEGEIIIATRVGLGKVCKLSQATAINQDLKAIVPKENNIVRDFIYYYFRDKAKYIEDNGVGATVKGVKIKFIEDLLFPLPPLSEQQRIVERLDSAFAHIDELKANAEKQVNEARALFQKALSKAMEPKDGWEEKTLKETAKYRRGSFPQPYGNKEWYDGEGSMPFVQVAELQEDSFNLVPITKRLISKIAQPLSVFVPAGTVLVTLQGSIGKVAITDYDSYVDRTIAIFQDYKIAVDKTFFAYQLKIRFEIERLKARGTTIKTITKEEFANFIINCPPLSEQQRIVERLDTLSKNVKALEENQRKVMAECDALKQALLRKVFE